MTGLINKNSIITFTTTREGGVQKVVHTMSGLEGDATVLRLINTKIRYLLDEENASPYRECYEWNLSADEDNPDGDKYPSLLSAATQALSFSDGHFVIQVFFDKETAQRIEDVLSDPSHDENDVVKEYTINSTLTFIVNADSAKTAKQIVKSCLMDMDADLSINHVDEWSDPILAG